MGDGLSVKELAAVACRTAEAHGLPSRFYTSEAAARQERDSVLADTWTCIGFASDLPARHAHPVELMGLPLIMVADPHGDIRVFHNVCRHRGHRLVSAPCKLKGALVCPYHSWTYAFDGALRGTPHIGGVNVHNIDGFDKSNRGLVPVRSAIWMDMVFVNLSGKAREFNDHISPLETRWREFTGAGGLGELKSASQEGCLQLEIACNWKLAVENFCESYHLPWIHPGLNSYSKIDDHYNIMAGDWGAGQGTKVFDFSERAGIDLPRFEDWPEDKLKVAEYIALFPNVLLGLQNDHFFAILLMPTGPDRIVETVKLYYLNEAATSDDYALARKSILDGWREVFMEDIGVCEGMQLGRNSPAFDGGAFSPALDVATHHFHKWVAGRLPTGDSDT